MFGEYNFLEAVVYKCHRSKFIAMVMNIHDKKLHSKQLSLELVVIALPTDVIVLSQKVNLHNQI